MLRIELSPSSSRPVPPGRAAYAILVAAALVSIGPASGQEAFVFRPYQRIRVTAPALGHYELLGRLLDVSRDGLRVRGVQLDYELVIPISMLDRLEVSRGRDRRFTVGAPLIGLGLGLALGPALLTEDERCRVVGAADPRCTKETSDLLIGGAVGFGLFAVASQILAPERWQEVLVAEIASGAGSPRRRSLRLGVRLRF